MPIEPRKISAFLITKCLLSFVNRTSCPAIVAQRYLHGNVSTASSRKPTKPSMSGLTLPPFQSSFGARSLFSHSIIHFTMHLFIRCYRFQLAPLQCSSWVQERICSTRCQARLAMFASSSTTLLSVCTHFLLDRLFTFTQDLWVQMGYSSSLIRVTWSCVFSLPFCPLTLAVLRDIVGSTSSF